MAFITRNASEFLDMDDAFCTRMCAAIAAGLENAPIGIITTPGTKNPKRGPNSFDTGLGSSGGWMFAASDTSFMSVIE